MWTGMAPIYMKGCIQALLGGPKRKPTYKVTRKEDDLRWHWRQTLPQTTLVLLVLFAGIYSLRHGTLPSLSLLAGAVYWGGLNVVLLTAFVSRGWHGLNRVRKAGASASAATSPAAEAGVAGAGS